jgi:hypothetical protein
MADRVSARRAVANAFFLTLTSALVALVGLVPALPTGGAGAPPSHDRFGPIVLSIAGLVVSLAWWVLLRSYRDINRAKFDVIEKMEARLPVALFREEWSALHSNKSLRLWRRFLELGQAERIVPLVYGAIFTAAAVRAFIA